MTPAEQVLRDGSPVDDVDRWLADALDALGTDSDSVAATLAVHESVVGSPFDEDPICLYLQWHVDPAQQVVQIQDCDIDAVTYAVLNGDGLTWTHASTRLPTPVAVYNCRADAGDFPHLQDPRDPPAVIGTP